MRLIDPWLLERLACPYDGATIQLAANSVACTTCRREFAVVEGIPVMLRDDVRQTHNAALASLAQVRPHSREPDSSDPTPDASVSAPPPAPPAGHAGRPTTPVDGFVQEAIGATCGLMYVPLTNRLTSYPIPELRLPKGPGAGRVWLDIGSNWGRWSVAAARAGYLPIGIDPTLGALRAAARVARQLGLRAHFIAGDARYLPLQPRTVDTAFSYSVLQHLAKSDVRRALREIRRVLTPTGTVVIQLPNARGLRSLWVQARRGWRLATGFEVRYWTAGELRTTFGRILGPTDLLVDGYFTLNSQAVDLPLLPRRYRAVVRTSEALRRQAERLPWLVGLADSLYVFARLA